MERILRYLALCSVVTLCLSSVTARADLILSFSGTVSSVNDPSSIVPGIGVGSTFTGSLSYTSRPYDSFDPSGVYTYEFNPPAGVFSFTTTVGGITFTTDVAGVPTVDVGNDLTAFDLTDLGFPGTFSDGDLFAVTQDALAPSLTAVMLLRLFDSSESAFSTAAVLPDSLSLTSFGIRRFTINGNAAGDAESVFSFEGVFDVDAVTPEPSSLALVASGLVCCCSFAMWRKLRPRIS